MELDTKMAKYTKDAVYAHTTCVLSGNYPDMHKTPISENTFVAGYLHGIMKGMDIAIEQLRETSQIAPTVFLQEEKKEPEY